MKTELISSIPYKKYKIKIEKDKDALELCKFLRQDNDRKMEININGKKVMLNSIAARRNFASGFEASAKIIYRRVKVFYNEIQSRSNEITSDLEDKKTELIEYKDENEKLRSKLRYEKEISEIKIDKLNDKLNELEETCQILKDRIENE